MARQKKPASQIKGKTINKAIQQKLMEEEQKLLTNTDSIYDIIPDNLDDVAKQYYKFLVTELKDTNILCDLDITTVANAADCISKMQECDYIIQSEGLFEKTIDRFGNEVKKAHPAIKIKHDYMTKYAQLSNALGLDPSSRAALAAKKVESKMQEEDPLFKLLADSEDDD